jgi:molybdate transport system permease protein
MGASRIDVFWHVSLPLARRGLLAGLLLAFARALGEFGATTMVLGSFQNQRTLPIYIYDLHETGGLSAAAPAVWLLTAVSLVVVVIYNRLPTARRE